MGTSECSHGQAERGGDRGGSDCSDRGEKQDAVIVWHIFNAFFRVRCARICPQRRRFGELLASGNLFSLMFT